MIEEGENFQFGADRDHDGYVFLQVEVLNKS